MGRTDFSRRKFRDQVRGLMFRADFEVHPSEKRHPSSVTFLSKLWRVDWSAKHGHDSTTTVMRCHFTSEHESPSPERVTADTAISDDWKIPGSWRRISYGNAKRVLAARAGASDIAGHIDLVIWLCPSL